MAAMADTRVGQVLKKSRIREKLSRKHSDYLRKINELSDLDWTNMEQEPVRQYPISVLTAQTLHFMIGVQYFSEDRDLFANNLRQLKELKESKELKFSDESGYGSRNDEQLIEFRNLKVQDISDMITYYQNQLDAIEVENEAGLNFEIPTIKTLNGLSALEKEYIDKIEVSNVKVDQGKSVNSIRTQAVILDDALCQVCNDGDYQDDNLIVFCAKCNIPVHQKCYMIECIPNEDWICDVCLNFGSSGQYLRCALCPKIGGAMKCTKQDYHFYKNLNLAYFEALNANSGNNTLNRQIVSYDFKSLPTRDISNLTSEIEVKSQQVWVHLSCFFWMPECYLDEKTNQMRGLDRISSKRFQTKCSLCVHGGAAVSCECGLSFHVECARLSGQYLSAEHNIFCSEHVPLKLKRVLESKNRQYEREIQEFFRVCDKQRKLKRIQNKKLQIKKLYKMPEQEENIEEFAEVFKQFIEQFNKFKINLSFDGQQYHYESYQIRQNRYNLKKVRDNDPKKQSLLPFMRMALSPTDPIWDSFTYKGFDKAKVYNLYEKLRRAARRTHAESCENKKQINLLDLFIQKKQKKVEIYYQPDLSLYCVCRGLTSDEMVECCTCGEWFHFKCLDLQVSDEVICQYPYYCFLCEDEMPQTEIETYKASHQGHFSDDTFKKQRELASTCDLQSIRKSKIQDKIQQALIEQELNAKMIIETVINEVHKLSKPICEVTDKETVSEEHKAIHTPTKTETDTVERKKSKQMKQTTLFAFCKKRT